jgi:hypothetical protein
MALSLRTLDTTPIIIKARRTGQTQARRQS